ncbi:phage tail fiber protein [Klebsiella pneumoniae]
MSVPNQTPYNVYTANGLTTVFTFEFYIISADDLQVSINGGVVTSGYTVGGVGNKDGGDITFLTPPESGAVVMLERVVPTYRLTDYQDNGDLLADTVNKDFDRLWMAMQRAFLYLGLALTRPLLGGPFDAEGYRITNIGAPVSAGDAATKVYVDNAVLTSVSSNFSRTLRVPENYVNQLPSAAARRNKAFGFDDAGDPSFIDPAATGLWGYTLLDSFELGATLNYRYQALKKTSTGEYFRWDGALPKTVPAGSTPESTGGVGLGAWVSIGDAGLRSQLGTIFMPGPSGNAGIDTANLQSALLLGGKIVCNKPGTYYYNTYSVIKSGTSFEIAAGATWKQVEGKSNPFLVNEGFSATRFVVTSMVKNDTAINIYLDGSDIKSKNYITVSCAGHPFVRGDWAAFHGAKEFGYDGIMRVISIIDENTFVAESHSMPVDASATPDDEYWNGMWCFKADSNIEVDIQGRLDGNWRGNSTASTTDFDERCKFMGLVFWGVQHLSVRINDAFNIRKYTALFANVRNVHIPRINFYNFSDGVHFQPPYAGVSIGTLAGATGDDMLALTNGDYETYQLSRGHGYSIYADHLFPQNALTAMKVVGATNYRYWDIGIGSISGSTRLHVIAAIRDLPLKWTDIGRFHIGSCACVSQTKDDFYLNTDRMDEFVIDNYTVCSPEGGTHSITMGNRYGTTNNIAAIKLRNVQYKEGVHLKSFYIGTNCNIGLLDIEFANATPLNGALAGVLTAPAMTYDGDAGESTGGFIDTLRLSGKYVFPQVNIGRLAWLRYKWNRIFLDNLYVENGERVIHENEITGNDGKIFCNNVHVRNTHDFCNTYNKVQAYHSSTLLETTDMPYWLRDASAELRIYGAVKTLNDTGVCRVEYGKYYAKGLDVPVNLFDFPPAGNHGDVVFNTNPAGYVVGRHQYNSVNSTWELENRASISQIPSDSIATTYNPDWNRGFNWVQTLTQDIEFTAGAANLAKLNRGDKVRLYLTQDATGGRAVTFSTAYKFPVAWVNGGTTGQHTIGEFVYDGQFLVLERANVWY